MSHQPFFPSRNIPKIYAYTDSRFPDCQKVGYTTKTAAERVQEQYPVKLPRQSWEVVLETTAIREDGSLFTDKDVHRLLRARHINNPDGEWFECSVKEVEACLMAIKTGRLNQENRANNFRLRPEQEAAITQTKSYYDSFRKEVANGTLSAAKVPRFLWNAKMRFGKTFTSY